MSSIQAILFLRQSLASWIGMKQVSRKRRKITFLLWRSLERTYPVPLSKSILQGYHTYRVNLAYRTDSSSETQHLSWFFKTGKGHQLVSISGAAKEILINEGEEASIRITGRYDDNVTEPLTNQVRYVSSDAAGLKLVSPATFKGIKAGNYYSCCLLGWKGAFLHKSQRIRLLHYRTRTKPLRPRSPSPARTLKASADTYLIIIRVYMIK